MRRSVCLAGVLTLYLSLGASPATQAQQTVRLRFGPAVGQWVQTLWWFEVTSTIRDSMSGADDIVIETAAVRGVSRRVVDAQGDRWTLEVTRDSIRIRTRPANGVWAIVADTGGQRPTAHLVVDQRMRVLDFQSLAPGADRAAEAGSVRAIAAGMELALPEEPVAVGQSWVMDVVVPLDAPTGLEDQTAVAMWIARAGDMVSRCTFTLDSLVDRGTDTLAFMRVRGTYLPTTVAAAVQTTEGRARFWGALSGSIVWSTGWHAFVAGALRSRLDMRALTGSAEDDRSGHAVRVDVDARFQVRR